MDTADKTKVSQIETENTNTESTVWAFPDIYTALEDDQSSNLDLTSKIDTPDKYGVNRLKLQLQEKQGILNEQLKRQEILNHELDQMKHDLQSKVKMLNHLLDKLKNPASVIDDELTTILDDIVKKIIKKILHNEFSLNPEIMLSVINELKKLIPTHDGLLTIYLSDHDYAILTKEMNMEQNQIKIDPNLKEGDVILKSNFTEVRALIDEQLEQLLSGAQYGHIETKQD